MVCAKTIIEVRVFCGARRYYLCQNKLELCQRQFHLNIFWSNFL